MATIALLAVFMVCVHTCVVVAYSSFRPGQPWLDTTGDSIRAHSGGILAHHNQYYWYGSDAYPGAAATLNRKINVYSSHDLYNWEYQGVAFEMPDRPKCTRTGMTCYADRCKVVFNEHSNQFVMWCKSKPYVSVSTASSPLGPFSLLPMSRGLFVPAGHEVGDCTLFQDPQRPADAYLILSVHPSSYSISHNETRQIKLFKLTPDWLSLTDEHSNVTEAWPLPNKYDGRLEAPTPFYNAKESTYYIACSHATGWRPNDAVLLSAKSLLGGGIWKRLGNPTHNVTSFGTQPTQVLQQPAMNGTAGEADRFVYITDQFEPYITQNQTGRYAWLPMTITAGSVDVSWKDVWQM